MNSETGGILGVFGFLVSMGGAIYAAINHKKVRCRCCGKNLDMSVDVDSTEEKEKAKEEPETKQEEEDIPDEDVEVERKHYRKARVVPVPEEA
jgi:hypothetical protein